MVFATRFVLVTLICCAAFAAALTFNQDRPSPVKVSQVETPMRGVVVQNITFKDGDIFDGVMEEGSRISDAVYESSDGVKVIHTTIFFNSPARANDELQKNIDDAIQVIERGHKSGTSQVGERVVITYASETQAEPQTAVLWTDGSKFHSIKAPFLLHALELEKSFSANLNDVIRNPTFVEQP